jgi:hypothetical protein
MEKMERSAGKQYLSCGWEMNGKYLRGSGEREAGSIKEFSELGQASDRQLERGWIEIISIKRSRGEG